MKKQSINIREKSGKRIICFPCLILFIFIYVGMIYGQGIDSTGCVTIDFETVPVDTVAEGLIISNQFLDSLGISFKLEDSTFMFPRIAEVGSPGTAFSSSYGADTPAPGQNIGNFFLTDDGLLSGLEAQPLIVNFNFPVDSISGYVLDIDFNETFTIEARDSMEQVIDSLVITAGDTGTGDGIATLWSFKRDNADIYSIRFEGSRTASGYFGLGFDNFCTCSPLRITSVQTENNNLVKSYSLKQNYPNPFNPTTKIKYQIPKSGNIKLQIFDALGREVVTLVNQEEPAGEYTVNFDGSSLTSGIYFYSIKTNDFYQVKKMILLK